MDASASASLSLVVRGVLVWSQFLYRASFEAVTPGGGFVVRRVHAALQRVLIESDLLENRCHRRDGSRHRC